MIRNGINTFECPSCGEIHIRCEIHGCANWAKWEGYQRRGIMIVLTRVCIEHKTMTIGGAKEQQKETT